MAEYKAQVVISAQDRASEVLRRLGSTVDKAQTSFERVNAPLLRFQTLWTSLVGGAVVAGFRSLIGSIDDLDEAAQGLGTTAVQLSNLRQAAGQAGVGAEAFDTALTRLNVNLSNAAAGSKEQAALFKALGVNIRDAGGNVRPTTQVLAELADRFAELEDGPAKAALAVDVFGKAGARMLPYLNEGSKGLEKFSGLTEETRRSAVQLQGEFDRLATSAERYKNSLASGALPELNKLLAGIERAYENVKNVDWTSGREAGGFFADFWKNSPAAQFAREQPIIEQRQRAIAEGLKVSGAEAVQARLSAQGVRDKIAADLAAESATRRKTAATLESSNAYAKEFADVARIRAAREAFNRDQDEDAQRQRDRASDRIEQLTGRSAARQQAEDVALLDAALAKGTISIIEYDLGISELFGRGNEIENGMKRQTDLAEQLGLTMASSLGELITTGGRAGDVWKALGQDITKLITQMLILKPLAEQLKKAFEGLSLGGGTGSSGGGLLGQLLSGAGSYLRGAFGGSAGASDPTGMGAYAGGYSNVNITNHIDGAVDRARISSYVETGVKAGLASSWDNVARGGSGVLS